MSEDAKQRWQEYKERELAGARALLPALGLTLEDVQPHVLGERYLMSGRKLVLLGRKDQKRIIIKLSSDPAGRREIETEHRVRNILGKLRFAYQTLLLPQEVLFDTRGGYAILASSFVNQEKTFLERPVEEQFDLALAALKAQEGVHATTYAHANVIRNTFGMWGASEYLQSFKAFVASTGEPLLARASEFLEGHRDTIEQYSGFLTHTDFVPHNLRVHEERIYLLDYTSLRFGNKYESWARFINFMLLYNRPLEQAMLQYVRDNRTPEEYLALRLMRIYKLAFLLCFYYTSLEKTSGGLRTLVQARIAFWTRVLESILNDVFLPQEIIEDYKQTRDALRSSEEKERQEQLH